MWQVGGILDHTGRFGSKKWIHIQRPSKRTPFRARAASCFLSELLFSDRVHAQVQTFQHYKIIMTFHSGACRNKPDVDNTGSIEITISIVLTRDFCDLTLFFRGKSIPRYCRFVSGLNLKHQLSQTVIILRKTSKIFVSNFDETATIFNLSLSVQLLKGAEQTSKKGFIF
jgi:hypothetical protein